MSGIRCKMLATIGMERKPSWLLLCVCLLLHDTFASGASSSDCDFEDGRCSGWKFGNCDGQSCFRVARASAMEYGPTSDHTSLKGDGWYAYAFYNGTGVARMERHVSGQFTLTLWYQLGGTGRPQLDIVVAPAGRSSQAGDLVYRAMEPRTLGWQRIYYREKRRGNYTVIIGASTSKVPESSIVVIDDIAISDRLDPPDASTPLCTFDFGNSCDFSQSGFSLINGIMNNFYSHADHTTGTRHGGYAVQTEWGSTDVHLITPVHKGSASLQCLSFYYYIHSDDYSRYSQLKVIVSGQSSASYTKTTTDITVWSTAGSHLIHNSWIPARASFVSQQDFVVGFRYKKGEHGKPFLAFDDISLTSCPQGRVQAEAGGRFDCDFESDLCTFHTARSLETYPWVLGSVAKMKRRLVKPKADHTLGNDNGGYVYVNTNGRLPTETAMLSSDVIALDIRKTQCVDFWYIISGKDVARLAVLQRGVSQRTSQEVWNASTGVADQWTLGRIRLPYAHRMFYQVNSKPFSNGYVALDDIRVYVDNDCQPIPGKVADEVDDLLSCSFLGESFCAWKPKDSKWFFGKGHRENLAQHKGSPEGDYIFVNRTSFKSLSKVGLVSATIPKKEEPVCIRFFYHMFAGDRADLQLTAITQATTERVTYFWRYGATLVDKWYEIRRTVTLNEGPTTLVFDIDTGGEFQGPLAIADIKASSGPCNADADDIGLCEFEYDTCDWKVEEDETVKWVRHRTTPDPVQFWALPEAVQSGAYMVLSSEKVSKASSALVSSEWSIPPRCLEFWYRHDQFASINLRAVLSGGKDRQILWTQPHFKRSNWILARVPVSSGAKGATHVRLEASWTGKAHGLSFLNLANVRLSAAPCDPVIDCTFESGLCGYVGYGVPDFMWKVGSGRALYPNHQVDLPPGGPSSTDPEQARPFAYIDASVPTSNIDIDVTTTSPIFEAKQGDSISITYFRKGKAIERVELNQVIYANSTTPREVSLGQLEPSDEWVELSKELSAGAVTQLVIVVRRSQQRYGILGLSSIKHISKHEDPASSQAFGCTFESGSFCEWVPEDGKAKWVLNDPTAGHTQSPSFDHTTGSKSGRFAIVEDSTSTGLARLRSPKMPLSWNTDACFSFWFVKYTDVGSLTLKMDKAVVPLKIPSPVSSWQQMNINIDRKEHSGQIPVYLEAAGIKGVLAIDDILLSPGSCKTSAKCTFEQGEVCAASGYKLNGRSWDVKEGRSFNIKDHTTNSVTGHFLYVNTTWVEKSAHPYARAIFEKQEATDATCLIFWWKGFGSASQLNVYRLSGDTGLSDPIVSLKTEQVDFFWVGRSVTVTSHAAWNPVFEVVMPNFLLADSGVLLDDIELRPGVCPPDDFCTFEHDLCLPWTSGSRDDTRGLRHVNAIGNWTVKRAGLHGGLPRDHTKGTAEGHYLYFSAEHGSGSSAAYVLTDPRYECVSFWYYLPRMKDGVQVNTRFELLTTPTSPKWKFAQFDVIRPEVIQARAGSNPDGFVAIDDIQLSTAVCYNAPLLTRNFSCGADDQQVASDKVCDFVVDCSNAADETNCASCTFEESQCGWSKTMYSTLYTWVRQTADRDGLTGPAADKTSRRPTAPASGHTINGRSWDVQNDRSLYIQDHTTSSVKGHYMVARRSSPRSGSLGNGRSTLRTRQLHNTGAPCTLTFWYNYKTTNNTVMLQARLDVEGQVITLWNSQLVHPRPREEVWNIAAMRIGRYKGPITVSLHAEENPLLSGYMAVDDVELGFCRIPAPDATCPGHQYRCKTGACIRPIQVCDYADDCGDGSDEENCGHRPFRCNFDSSLCDWHKDPDSTVTDHWERRGPFLDLADGPSRDRTTGTQDGQFLYLGSSNKPTSGTLYGPWLAPDNGCMMHFFFVAHGPAKVELSVNARLLDGSIKRIRRTSASGFFYFIGDSAYFSQSAPFQVIFEGFVNSTRGRKGYIAVDDITFSATCKPYTGEIPHIPKVVPAAKLCPGDQFSCTSSKECIPRSQVCDFMPNCKDKSDEASCGACDFSLGMCGLYNTPEDAYYTWQRLDVEQVSNNPLVYRGFPTADSAGATKGGYCSNMIGDPDVPRGTSSALRSPLLGATGHSCMITFYSFFQGLRVSRDQTLLTVGVQDGARKKKFLEVTRGNSQRHWTKVAVNVGNWHAGVQFYFESSTPNVTIDDIRYEDCHPSSSVTSKSVTCDFEAPESCSWYHENHADDYDWVLGSGRRSAGPQEFPQGDHTSGRGSYTYVTSTPGNPSQVSEPTARLVSARQGPTRNEGRCFTFYYYMARLTTGKLQVLLSTDNGTIDTVWTRSGPGEPGWNAASFNIRSSSDFQIIFEASMKASGDSVMAIDDITFDDKPCFILPTCTFEQGSCGWHLQGWEVIAGRQAKISKSDHTLSEADGHFASLKAPPGTIALPQVQVPEGETRCLKFWYYVAQTRAEVLRVARVFSSKEDTLWTIHGEDTAGTQWTSASVNIPGDSESFSLSFIGKKSNLATSVVRVDDIYFSDHACPRPGSCTFEDDTCDWRNVGAVPWVQTTGMQRIPGAEPSQDHTTSTALGRYMLMDSEKRAVGGVAVLESGLLHYAPTSCLAFYYYMAGEEGSDTTLSVDYVVHNNVVQHVRDIIGNQGPAWQLYRQRVQDLPTSYNIRLTGSLGIRNQLDIAIDDIVVHEKDCQNDAFIPAAVLQHNTTEWDCSFDHDLCNWKGESWIIRSGNTAARTGRGPTMDSRMQTSQGRYAYYSSEHESKSNALASPPLKPSKTPYCIEFWYFLFSLDPVQLQVSVGTDQQARVIWLQREAAERIWRRASATYLKKDDSTDHIIIEAPRKPADVAIDDVRVSNTGTCKHPVGSLCDFEGDGLCGYEVRPLQGTYMTRVSASVLTSPEVPKGDHTFGSKEGHYMVVTANDSIGAVGSSLLLPGNPPTTGSCLRFWYSFGPETTGFVAVMAEAVGTTRRIQSLHDKTSVVKGWLPASFTLRSDVPYDAVISAMLAPGSTGSRSRAVALDDVLLTEGACPDKGRCSFEEGLCNWHNSRASNVDRLWVRNRGATPGPGPAADHTLGTIDGSYIFMQGGPAVHVAVLESEPKNATLPSCLTFWYYMAANSLLFLRVLVVPADLPQEKGMDSTPVVEYKNMTAGWQKSVVDIPASNGRPPWIRIRFVGKNLNFEDGEVIALDDVVFQSGVCNRDKKFDCKDGRTEVPVSEVCDFTENCPGGEDEAHCGQCKFDRDTCVWSAVGGTVPWKWNLAEEAGGGTGSGSNHTVDGGYVWVTSSVIANTLAVLTTPVGDHVFKRSWRECAMSFWFYMTGQHSPMLQVKKTLMGIETTMWRHAPTGSEGTWRQGMAMLGRNNKEFSVQLHASPYKVNNYGSALVVESVDFVNCGLPQGSDGDPCDDDQSYRCRSTKVCIDRDRLCDHADDCGDGEDELSCAAYHNFCTFEMGSACDWSSPTSDDPQSLSWVVLSPYFRERELLLFTGPTVDHTTDVGLAGRVLLLQPQDQRHLGRSAHYVSPTYVAPGAKGKLNSCQLRFFYYMYGKDVGTLTVYAQFDSNPNVSSWRALTKFEGNIGQFWARASFDVTWTVPFRFSLTGTLKDEGFAATIAVDDISLTPGCELFNGSLPDATPKTCQPSQFTCRDGSCVPAALLCDYKLDCNDGSDEDGCGPCDFERDTCGWRQSSVGAIQWVRSEVRNRRWLQIDHTTGSGDGHVMLVNNNRMPHQRSVRLLSPPLPPTSSACVIELWVFYRQLKEVAEPLFLRHLVTGKKADEGVVIPGGSKWKVFRAPVPQYTRDSRIDSRNDSRIELYLKLSEKWTSRWPRQLAVDDISFSENCTSSLASIPCDFDDPHFNEGFCRWKNDPVGGLTWEIEKGTRNDATAKSGSDHTAGIGGYALLTAEASSNKYARLQSPILQPSAPDASCFSFWYYSFEGEAELAVSSGPDAIDKESIDKESIGPAFRWIQRQYTINSSLPHTVSIEATPLAKSSLALDDFSLSHGACRNPGTCDFETDMCDWTATVQGLTQGWQRTNSSSTGAGPDGDHTLKSSFGHYVITKPLRQGDRALLSSPTFRDVGERCLDFWYSMHGQAGTLSVYENATGYALTSTLRPVWKRSGERHGVWQKGRAPLPGIRRYAIVVEAFTTTSVASDYDGYLALDDTELKLGPCTNSVKCNFEKGTCGWTVNAEGASLGFDWKHWKAEYSSSMGGPPVDTTTLTSHGSYMYLPISFVTKGRNASLSSEQLDIKADREFCFSYSYFMKDTKDTVLRVQAVYDGYRTISLGEINEPTYNWEAVQHSFFAPAKDTDMYLTFTAETQDSFALNKDSGIAVDDVDLKFLLCGAAEPQPKPQPEHSPHPLDCDFENGTCIWASDSQTSFWKTVTGERYLRLPNLMPKTDHTTMSIYGSYASVFNTHAIVTDAVLVSGTSIPTGGSGLCIMFWYYMHGTSVSPLLFYGMGADGNTTYWERDKSTGPQWNYGQAFVPEMQDMYFAFRSRRVPEGIVALDDISAQFGKCQPPKFCDFESDECGWVPTLEGSLRWERKGVMDSGVGKDHTEGTASGHAFFVNFNPVDDAQRNVAMVFSPLFSKEEASCMRFWYYISGKHTLSAGTERKLLTAVNALLSEPTWGPPRWRAAQVQVSQNSPDGYNFFLRSVSTFRNGTIGVDDIQFLAECPSLGSCNFEDDFCMWENEHVTRRPLAWTRNNGRNHPLGPRADHTFGAVYGTYAVVALTPSQRDRFGSKLVSPNLQDCSTGCLSFWLYRNGTHKHDLDIFLRRGYGDEVQEYQVQEGGEGQWLKGQVRLASNSACQIGFAPSFPNIHSAFYALDDLEFTKHACKPLEDFHHPSFTCDSGKTHLTQDKICNFIIDCKDGTDEAECGLTCDFEQGNTCNWTLEDRSTKWVLKQALSGELGLTDDKTTGSSAGHYMKLVLSEEEDGSVENGRMVSPYLRNAAPTCRFTFWFRSALSGESSVVKVRMRSASATISSETTALVLQGRKHPTWRKAEAVLGRVINRFAVVLMGSLEKGNMTFVVDDITYENCEAPQPISSVCSDSRMYRCANGHCISRDLLCDFNDDCGDMSDEGTNPRANCEVDFPGRCDFENGRCDWYIGRNWQLRRRRSGSAYATVHPASDSRDHTTNTLYGNYLVFQFRFQPRNTKGSVESPLVVASSQGCALRFFYTYSTVFRDIDYESYGRGSGSLQVFVRVDELGAPRLLWKTSRVFGQYFERKTIHLGDVKGVFEVYIEATSGTDVNGAWLVDDVSFTDECHRANESRLPNLVPTPTPAHSECNEKEFVCGNGQCVDSALRCDFKQDCADGTDETHCATCSFDKDTCGWVDMSEGVFSWVRMKHGDGGMKPLSDKSGGGYFMSVERQGEGVVGETARMTSVPLEATAGTCRVEFYYYRTASVGGNNLQLKLIDENQSSFVLENLAGDTENQWSHTVANIGKRNASWRLEFQAKSPHGASRIGVDEVTLIECATASPDPKKKCNAYGMVSCPGLAHQCIYESQLCDFAEDCSDGSDETKCDAYTERCDFEHGMCSWTLRKGPSNTVRWEIGPPQQPPAGLASDHTYGNGSGHYLYRKRTDPWEGGLATVQSALFEATTSQKCHVRLWYSMAYGDGDRLRVLVRKSNARIISYGLATAQGDRAGRWQKLDVALSSPTPFHTMISARQKPGAESIVAIDDISFTPECDLFSTTPEVKPVQPEARCKNESEFACEDNSCISTDLVCDFKEDCPEGRDEKTCPSLCDFEDHNECGWRASKEMPPHVTWKALTALEAEIDYPGAPHRDTTENDTLGYYLLIWIGPGAGVVSDGVRLISPTFHQATPDCRITFSYWLYYSLINVKVLLVSQGNPDIVLFQRQSITSEDKSWKNATIGVGRRKDPFQIAIEVTTQTVGTGSVFAVDDFRFLDCAYPKQLPQHASCGPAEVSCGSHCVSKDKRCDLYEDCRDGSDESSCHNVRITFDDGSYGALQLHAGSEHWPFVRGRSPLRQRYDTGPLFDHTTFTPAGAYVQYGGKAGRYDRPNYFYTPVFAAGTCRVTFHMYMYGDDVNVARVHKRHVGEDEAAIVWEQKGQIGDYWVRRTLLFEERKDFEVVFEARSGNGSRDVIALDDVSFGEECSTATSHTGEPVPMRPGTPSTPGSVTVSTTSVIPRTCNEDQFDCGGKCIPSILACDGVPDCADGSDENCGDREQCPPEEFYCAHPLEGKHCMPRTWICDGHPDCADGKDESLCGVCPRYFCHNGGICMLLETNGFPNCSCGRTYGGTRCSTSLAIGPPQPANVVHTPSTFQAWHVILPLLILLAIGVAVGVVFYRRNRPPREPDSLVSFVNPGFGIHLEDIPPTPAEEAEESLGVGIMNPMYSVPSNLGPTEC